MARALIESERAFQDKVIQLAHYCHWKVAHIRPAMTGRTYIGKDGRERHVWITPVQADGKGLLDLILVRDRVLWREIKVKAKVTPEQQAWLDWLRAAGQDADVWRPEDWGRILSELE